MKKELGEKYQQMKDHVRNHKESYIAGGTAFVVGGLAVGAAVVLRQGTIQTAAVVQGLAYKSPVEQHVIQFVERSTPSKRLHKVGTHEYYDSIHDCARKTGHSVAMLSRQINGHISHVGKDVFEEVVQPQAA